MKIINAGYKIITPMNRDIILKRIEEIGRVCYKSEDLITSDSASKFVSMLVKRGHLAMIEHCSISVKFICDRGVSHEIVRHRIASYAQESTRYCNYSKDKFNNEITVIKPCFFEEDSNGYVLWADSCENAEFNYFNLLKEGYTPQEARSVLPNSLKTEIVVTYNLRGWINFFKLRTPSSAHPQMREVAIPLLEEFKTYLPEIFGDIEVV